MCPKLIPMGTWFTVEEKQSMVAHAAGNRTRDLRSFMRAAGNYLDSVANVEIDHGSDPRRRLSDIERATQIAENGRGVLFRMLPQLPISFWLRR